MKKTLAAILLATLSCSVAADSIRTKSGISCTQDNDGDYNVRTYVEGGEYSNDHNSSNPYDSNSNDARVGIEFEMNFGGPKRLKCDDLYQLALREERARVAELEAKIKLLEKANKASW